MPDSPLQKSPVGILEGYNLKTLGDMPDVFSGTVSSVVETFQHYTTDRRATGVGTGAAAAYPLAIQHVLVAPVLIHSFAGEVVIGAAAGTRLDITLFVRVPTRQSLPHFLTLARVGTPIAANRFFASYTFAQGMILPAGSSIEMLAQSDAAGADHTPNISFLITTLV